MRWSIWSMSLIAPGTATFPLTSAITCAAWTWPIALWAPRAPGPRDAAILVVDLARGRPARPRGAERALGAGGAAATPRHGECPTGRGPRSVPVALPHRPTGQGGSRIRRPPALTRRNAPDSDTAAIAAGATGSATQSLGAPRRASGPGVGRRQRRAVSRPTGHQRGAGSGRDGPR